MLAYIPAPWILCAMKWRTHHQFEEKRSVQSALSGPHPPVHLNETLFLTPLATEVPRDHPICLRHPGKLQQLGKPGIHGFSNMKYGSFMDFLGLRPGKIWNRNPEIHVEGFFPMEGASGFNVTNPTSVDFIGIQKNNGLWNGYIRKLKSPRNWIFMQTPGVLEEIWWILNICFMYGLFFEHHENLQSIAVVSKMRCLEATCKIVSVSNCFWVN